MWWDILILLWCNRQGSSALRRTRLSSLSIWLGSYLINRSDSRPVLKTIKIKAHSNEWASDFLWCNRQGSNLWPPPSQGGALIQLSYGCINTWTHCIVFFEKSTFSYKKSLECIERWSLALSRHTIEIKSLEVYHRFCDIIFLLSFFKKTSFIENSHFDELIDIFCWELLFWKGFFVLIVSSSFFVWQIKSWLFIFISCIDKSCFFLVFCKFACSCLFFYETRW